MLGERQFGLLGDIARTNKPETLEYWAERARRNENLALAKKRAEEARIAGYRGPHQWYDPEGEDLSAIIGEPNEHRASGWVEVTYGYSFRRIPVGEIQFDPVFFDEFTDYIEGSGIPCLAQALRQINTTQSPPRPLERRVEKIKDKIKNLFSWLI